MSQTTLQQRVENLLTLDHVANHGLHGLAGGLLAYGLMRFAGQPEPVARRRSINFALALGAAMVVFDHPPIPRLLPEGIL
jgi:hypothetical protein